MMMTVLGIDPGSTKSGAVVWDGASIKLAGVYPNEALLQLVQDHAVDPGVALAIEDIGHYGSERGAVGEDIFATCKWIGRFGQRWLDNARAHQAVQLFLRKSVASHITGRASSNDAAVRDAVHIRLRKLDIDPRASGVTSHAVQACATAMVALDLLRIGMPMKRLLAAPTGLSGTEQRS
jgi:Holliday junction resolvasome RuvABC endonuclease subunit